MKTEMQMLNNGNYERVVSVIQHKCRSKDSDWHCVEYASKSPILLLSVEKGDPYEDGFSSEIEVKFCPFCGYQPERLNPKDVNNVYDSLNHDNK